MNKLAPGNLRRRWAPAVALMAAVVVAAVAVALSGRSHPPLRAARTTAAIPGDALAYVSISLDDRSPAVRRALALVDRLPNGSLGGTVALGRLGEVLAGGRAVNFSTQVLPWAGARAALALLNSPTSTAGSLVVVDVANLRRARSFVRAEGAVSAGSYRGTAVDAYPDGNVLAFAGHELVIGRRASVRTALDVAAGARPALAGGIAYRRAAAPEPAGSVLDAYAPAAGVRRVLAGQGGLLGSLGSLLSQPGLQGAVLWLQPTAGGARVEIHSALASGPPAAGSFSPTLQNVIPAGASLMLDVHGLDRALPQVLSAGSATGLAAGIGPLLRQLGTALDRGGVDVPALVSLFSGQSALAILGSGRSSTLVIASAVADQPRAQAVLGQLERAMGRLVPASGTRSAARSVFRAERVDGIPIHAFQLTPTLALDYALLKGMIVVATNPRGIAAVAHASHPLGAAPAFRTAVGRPAGPVTALGYADLRRLVAEVAPALSAGGGTAARLLPDLQRLGAVGFTSTRTAHASTTQLTFALR